VSTLYIGSAVVKCTICLMLMLLYVEGEGVSLPNNRETPPWGPTLTLLYTSFLTENLPLSYTVLLTNATPLSYLRSFGLCIYLNGFSKFSWLFSQPQNASFSLYGPFSRPKKKNPYPSIYFSDDWIPDPFIYLKPKKCPFRAELPCIDHCRKYPPGNLTGLFLMSWTLKMGFLCSWWN